MYLDAVFHPLSVNGPLPFRQEGWHYEMKDGELVRNGVVLSEMKGAFGNPHRLAFTEVNRMLFPDNCYGRCSGGDPASIHNLTFEKYREFYFRHYHPSNARIFLDGRVDMPAMLAKLDSFLSAYGRNGDRRAHPAPEARRGGEDDAVRDCRGRFRGGQDGLDGRMGLRHVA